MKVQLTTRIWNVARNTLILATTFAVVVMILPSQARSQLGLDPCCAIISVGLSTISNLLKSAVAAPLGNIQQSAQDNVNFEQQVVSPIAAINQARAFAVQAQTQFAQMRQISQLSVASATLPASQRLEGTLLSANPNNVAQVSNSYTALYGQVMPATDAPQAVRDFVDMTDAEAQAAMKKALEIDALANLELQAAEQINQQLQTAAPGSAAILEAQTSAWVVRANAYTQSALGDVMRLRAVTLANSGAQLKFNASGAAQIRQNALDSLK